MTITLSDNDTRNNPRTPVANRGFLSKVVSSAKFMDSEESKTINGTVYGVRTTCPSLATDVVFQLDVVDSDGVTIGSETGIAHNSDAYTLFTTPFIAKGQCHLKYTFVTDQSLTAEDILADLLFR